MNLVILLSMLLQWLTIVKGQVTPYWGVFRRATDYGQTVTLRCVTRFYGLPPVGFWDRYIPDSTLTFAVIRNETSRSDLKYYGEFLENGFTLEIRNLSKEDLNIKYECSYYVVKSPARVLREMDVFEGSLHVVILAKVARYGETLKLLCVTESCNIETCNFKYMWSISYCEYKTIFCEQNIEETSKYHIQLVLDGFALEIRNLSNTDLNISYQCSLPFNLSKALWIDETEAFQGPPSIPKFTEETLESGKILGITFGAFVLIISILIALRKRRKCSLVQNLCSPVSGNNPGGGEDIELSGNNILEDEEESIVSEIFLMKHGNINASFECPINNSRTTRNNTSRTRVNAIFDVPEGLELRVETFIDGLNRHNDNPEHGFRILFAEQKCILLHLEAKPGVFESRETIREALAILLQDIVEAGKINPSVPLNMRINIQIVDEESGNRGQSPVKHGLPSSAQRKQSFKIQNIYVSDSAVSAGSIILTSNNQKNLIIIDSDEGNIRHTLLSGIPWSVTIIDATTAAVTFPDDNILQILDIQSGLVKLTIKIRSKKRCSLSYHKDLLYLDYNGKVSVIDLQGNIKRTFSLTGGFITAIKVDSDRIYHTTANCCYCCDLYGNEIWKLEDKKLINGLRGLTHDTEGNAYIGGRHTSNVVVVSPDGQDYREIISKSDGLEGKPWAICFSRATNELCVCTELIPNSKEGKISFFAITRRQN